MDCFLWFKDTKMKANHNSILKAIVNTVTVSYGSKILKWKQITTPCYRLSLSRNCFLWFKDTKMKANHNLFFYLVAKFTTVSYGSKILKWKQITTGSRCLILRMDCFLWFKDTKMKANHNNISFRKSLKVTVSYGSKILKWKQITTNYPLLKTEGVLFPMVQRY